MTASTDIYSDARVGRAVWQVEITTGWSDAAEAWTHEARKGAGTPFQQPGWLFAFYTAAKERSDVSPLIVTLRRDGEVAMRLPLIVRDAGLKYAEFADLGMTDFNAPLLGPAAPVDAASARDAMRALKKALPADILSLTKMPPMLKGRVNPLTLKGAEISAVNGNLLTVGENWDEYRHAEFERTFRKELERSGRVFAKAGGAFRRITEKADALAMLARMEEQQRARMEEIGQAYTLDEPVTAAFYRALMAEVETDLAVLTVLEAKAELVAALLSVRDRDSLVMIRLTNAGKEWSSCSPGRLLIAENMAHFHKEGYRRFDFSIGNYAYKRRFGPTRTPLYDVVAPLSVKGLMPALKLKVAARMRRYPETRAKLRALMGKPVSREEI